MPEIEKDFPEVIYFYKKEGSNGVSCLDYKNDSDIKFIRFDIHVYQIEQLKEQLAQKDKEIERLTKELREERDKHNWYCHGDNGIGSVRCDQQCDVCKNDTH